MAETQLISISDVQEYRKIDPKLNEDRFNSYVNEIQRINLKDLLSPPLYYDFMNSDRTAGVYKDLLDGKSYVYNGNTIQFYGLKPYLCYLWLAIYTREGELYHSAHGAIQFMDNPQQNFAEAKKREQIAQNYMQIANDYANEIRQFLTGNSNEYPLWEFENEGNSSEFISFRI